MERYVLAPDSFKGTLESREICAIVTEEILRAKPNAQVISLPVADGGEGSVDAFLTALGGTRVDVPCHGPYMEPITGFYGMLPNGIAVIEVAAAAGLPLVGENRDPSKTTTYGIGELMAHAAANGAKQIILGLGGSATNDGGCGAAAALGIQFLDADGNTFVPTGGSLSRLCKIDATNALPLPQITVMCDVKNPLCGENGASAVFGPQKGATPEMVKALDTNLRHLAAIIHRDIGTDVMGLPGAGAAGGMGGGAVAFFHGKMQMGIEVVLDTVDFDRIVKGARLVITGEGRLDGQSLQGKVIDGVAKRASRANVPVVAIVGAVGDGADSIYELGVCGVFTTNHAPVPFEIAKHHAHENLRRTARNLIGLIDALDRQNIR